MQAILRSTKIFTKVGFGLPIITRVKEGRDASVVVSVVRFLRFLGTRQRLNNSKFAIIHAFLTSNVIQVTFDFIWFLDNIPVAISNFIMPHASFMKFSLKSIGKLLINRTLLIKGC